MKRKLNETEEVMRSVHLNKICKRHHVKNVIMKDIFEIGQLREDKVFYTQDEVVELLNKREGILYTKFNDFLKSNSVYNFFVPRWVF